MENTTVLIDPEDGDPTLTEVECSICLTSVVKSNSISLKMCGCSFCRDCLSQMVKVNVEGHTIQRLKCPAKHDTLILRKEVKTIVDSDTYLKYIRLVHENSVLMDPSRYFCPRPGCSAVCHSSGRLGARAVRCIECGFKFCSLCHDRWPGPQHQCPEDIPILNQPQHRQSLTKDEPVTEDDTVTSSQFFEDHVTIETPGATEDVASFTRNVSDIKEEKKEPVKRCPRCGVPIQRREGCGHMKCARCGHSFCWFCLASLDHDYFLQHYENGPCRDALGYPPQMVHLYRCQAMCLICGIGTLALICAPFAIICSPCIVLCAPYVPRLFFHGDNDENGFQPSIPSTLDEFGDDTDSEPEIEFSL